MGYKEIFEFIGDFEKNVELEKDFKEMRISIGESKLFPDGNR